MLRNFEVIKELGKKYEISIRSSQQLNKLLQRLGLIEKIGTDWIQTDLGMKFSPYRGKTLRASEWLESVVDFIAEHVR